MSCDIGGGSSFNARHFIQSSAMHWILSKGSECEAMPTLLIEDQLTSEEYMNAQCKSSYLRLTLSLKKRLLSAYNLEKRPSIQWGLTHEKVAIDSYCKLSEVSVLQTGIWLHESGVLGAFPDGFVQGDPKTCNMNVHLQSKLTASPAILESVTLRALCVSKRGMTIGIKFKANFNRNFML
ncbi:uncharacterized protein LOC128163870 isoform X5 [Crassostrea angulata]|uniref:uncharacterized protein LOC128163870 isoform X5 n=1 Tax=Magallana angulata TaxID=2784310 RepID=UPI0022B0DB2D|nr:uncharacterized protein LOC128163870 isoform X5 [Crassostrea angulata]